MKKVTSPNFYKKSNADNMVSGAATIFYLKKIWNIFMALSLILTTLITFIQVKQWVSEKSVPLQELHFFIFNLIEAGESNRAEACLEYYQFPIKNFFGKHNVSYADALRNRKHLIEKWPSRAYSLVARPQLLAAYECEKYTCWSLTSTFVYEAFNSKERIEGRKTVEYVIRRLENGKLRVIEIYEFKN